MDKIIKDIYLIMLKSYKKDFWWADWDIIERNGKPGWLHGLIFETISKEYGRFLEKYWVCKK